MEKLLQRAVVGGEERALSPHALLAIHLSKEQSNPPLERRIVLLLASSQVCAKRVQQEVMSHLQLSECTSLFVRCATFLRERKVADPLFVELCGTYALSFGSSRQIAERLRGELSLEELLQLLRIVDSSPVVEEATLIASRLTRHLFDLQCKEVWIGGKAAHGVRIGVRTSNFDLIEVSLAHLRYRPDGSLPPDDLYQIGPLLLLRLAEGVTEGRLSDEQACTIYCGWQRIVRERREGSTDYLLPLLGGERLAFALLTQIGTLRTKPCDLPFLESPVTGLIATWGQPSDLLDWSIARRALCHYLNALASADDYDLYADQLPRLAMRIFAHPLFGQEVFVSTESAIFPAIQELLTSGDPWKTISALQIVSSKRCSDPALFRLLGHHLVEAPCGFLPLRCVKKLQTDRACRVHLMAGLLRRIQESGPNPTRLGNFFAWQAYCAGFVDLLELMENLISLQFAGKWDDREALALLAGYYQHRALQMGRDGKQGMVAILPGSNPYAAPFAEAIATAEELESGSLPPTLEKRKTALVALSVRTYVQALETESRSLFFPNSLSDLNDHIGASIVAVTRIEKYAYQFGVGEDRLIASLLTSCRGVQASLMLLSRSPELQMKGRLTLADASTGKAPAPLLPYERTLMARKYLESTVEALRQQKQAARLESVSKAVGSLTKQRGCDELPLLALEAITDNLNHLAVERQHADLPIIDYLIDSLFVIAKRFRTPDSELGDRLHLLVEYFIAKGTEEQIALLDRAVERSDLPARVATSYRASRAAIAKRYDTNRAAPSS